MKLFRPWLLTPEFRHFCRSLSVLICIHILCFCLYIPVYLLEFAFTLYDILKHCRTIANFETGLVKWEGVTCNCSNCILCGLKEYCNVLSTRCAGVTPHLSSISMSPLII